MNIYKTIGTNKSNNLNFIDLEVIYPFIDNIKEEKVFPLEDSLKSDYFLYIV